MLVRIDAPGVALATWLDAEVTWTAQAGREHGAARVMVPRGHPAWESGAIRPGGGMLVRIGRWAGVADVPTWSGAGAELSVREVSAWVATRKVGTRRAFRGVTAGCIVRAAVRDAFTGLAVVPVRAGAVVEAAPLIDRYQFTGQTLERVLGDLQEQTGHEWAIDPLTLLFSWQPTQGRYREDTIVDAGILFRELQPGSLADTYRETIERDSRTQRAVTAWHGGAPTTWPAQRLVTP